MANNNLKYAYKWYLIGIVAVSLWLLATSAAVAEVSSTYHSGETCILNMENTSVSTATPKAPATPCFVPQCTVTSSPTFTGTPTFTSTPTVTGTPPTSTRTNTPTFTFTPTATCGPSSDYLITQSTGAIDPGTADRNSHCDDCYTMIGLPFSYSLYGLTTNGVNVSSNGNIQFGSSYLYGNTGCLPASDLYSPIAAYWDDVRTDQVGSCTSYPTGCGIFTSVTGTTPNSIFNIEWRTVYFNNNAQLANFEVRLYEGQRKFDIIYGRVDQAGGSATVGVQNVYGPQKTQFECNTGVLYQGLLLTFAQPPCGTLTPSSTPTSTRTYTNTPTITLTRSATSTFTSTATPTNSPTSTPTNTLTYTFTSTHTVTPTYTPTYTPAPDVIIGHLTWQGIPQPDTRNADITGTITLCAGGIPYSYTATTDTNGSFIIGTGLPDGTYNWWFKGPKWLATSGTLTLSGTTNQELGLQRVGDANDSNGVSSQDFTILRNTFGKQPGDPGYDPSADFNNDRVCSSTDFTLLKGSFGQVGAAPNCP